MPYCRHCSVTRRTVSTPLLCPATRGRPLRSAHRPLPSMMTATCFGRLFTSSWARSCSIVWFLLFIPGESPFYTHATRRHLGYSVFHNCSGTQENNREKWRMNGQREIYDVNKRTSFPPFLQFPPFHLKGSMV